MNQKEDSIKDEDDIQEKIQRNMYKDKIGNEEFAFLFEEMILSKIQDQKKVDLVIVSSTCSMNANNSKLSSSFNLSESTFFKALIQLS